MIGDVLLDTTVAVAHLRGLAAVSQRLIEARTRYLPTVALGELYFGVCRSARPDENRQQLQRWLSVTMPLPVTPAISQRYGTLKDQLARIGSQIPENDRGSPRQPWSTRCPWRRATSTSSVYPG